MFAYDVNGDGLTDVVTALAAHGYGFAWYQQLKDKDANGTPKFKPCIFMNKEPAQNRYGVTFSDAATGAPAMVEWLCNQGCVGFQYDFDLGTSFDDIDREDL